MKQKAETFPNHKGLLKVDLSIQKKNINFSYPPPAPPSSWLVKLPSAWEKLIALPKGEVHHLHFCASIPKETKAHPETLKRDINSLF